MHQNILVVEHDGHVIKKTKWEFPQHLIAKTFDNYFHIRIMLNLSARFMD